MIMTSAVLKAFNHASCKTPTVSKEKAKAFAAAFPDLWAVISLVGVAAAFAFKRPSPLTNRVTYYHTFFVEFIYAT
jgi:hypothetical protein